MTLDAERAPRIIARHRCGHICPGTDLPLPAIETPAGQAARPSNQAIAFTILGEPSSKSNSRIPRVVTSKASGKQYAKFIKSKKANLYQDSAILQIPAHAKQMLEGPVFVALRIFYASERPDLDESVVLDVLQAKLGPVVKGKPREIIRDGVYLNDRQVRKKLVEHFIDRANPRTEITVEPMQPQQPALIPNEPAPKPIRDARKAGRKLPPSHATPRQEFADIPFDVVRP